MHGKAPPGPEACRPPGWTAERLPRPPVPPQALAQLGGNINGPSLIRTPDWLPGRLGRYYLYFAHHHGLHIRLAFADDLEGPWTLWKPGTLRVEQTPCAGHIASPDVHVDEERREIRMYFHGPLVRPGSDRKPQVSFVSRSSDGLHFVSEPGVLGSSYFRVVQRQDHWLAMAWGGNLYRSADGFCPFEPGPNPFAGAPLPLRHVALRLDGEQLSVFHSCIGGEPEHIQVSHLHLGGDWDSWVASPPVSVLRPEWAEEGAALPVAPSVKGRARGPLHQLRDPAYFREGDCEYLLYSMAGESGIGLARLLPRRS